jgi:hypothetical protein
MNCDLVPHIGATTQSLDASENRKTPPTRGSLGVSDGI